MGSAGIMTHPDTHCCDPLRCLTMRATDHSTLEAMHSHQYLSSSICIHLHFSSFIVYYLQQLSFSSSSVTSWFQRMDLTWKMHHFTSASFCILGQGRCAWSIPGIMSEPDSCRARVSCRETSEAWSPPIAPFISGMYLFIGGYTIICTWRPISCTWRRSCWFEDGERWILIRLEQL